MTAQNKLQAVEPESHCILCNETQYSLVLEMNGYQIVKCKNCTFVYALPLPSDEDLRKFYANADKYDTYLKKLTKIKRLKRRLRYYFYARGIKKYFPRDKKIRLLELGCYHGDFLLSLKDDPRFEASGIDIDVAGLKIARELGLKVYEGTLDDVQFDDDSFDCVFASHVLEHVRDPIGVLQQINRILAKGGVLVVIVPCVSHIKAKIYGKKWKYYGPPAHLWYFSNQTFKLYLEKVGLIPELVSSLSHRAHLKVVARKR